LVSFYVCNKVPIYIVVVALVTPLAAVLFGQLDPVAFNSIDRTDVNSICAGSAEGGLNITRVGACSARTG
jgi:hypothetical protein